MKIETRIIKKGIEVFTEDGEKLTPTRDLYLITVTNGEDILFKRLFDDLVFAGDGVRSAEAFCRYLVQN
ncbi:MAG: hypothetical protein IKU15_05840 [Clostridia bacterium]|nr:hypothetical protein [Clostridia bacterium]